jgi:short-chain fatty acids transporter
VDSESCLAIFGVFALVRESQRTHGAIDINFVIMTLVLLGLLLHWRPIAYINAVKKAARITGPLILQYPLYGGLMGIITTTGLAALLSKLFIRFSTAYSLPFFTYLTSLVITLFVPSGGGHWAVQGPFAISAAQNLHASLPGTTMAVAMGESVANMLQPFFALPILAIAGIRMRRMMGFMVITFFVSLIIFGISLLTLVPLPAHNCCRSLPAYRDGGYWFDQNGQLGKMYFKGFEVRPSARQWLQIERS